MKRNLSLLILPVLTAFVLLLCPAPARAGQPELHNIVQVAGQQGTDVEVRFYGRRLQDAPQVLFHTEGITAGPVEVVDNNQVKATLTIAPDAALGEHQLRIVTSSGVSEMRTFHVTALPTVSERDGDDENNNRFDQPQPIELDRTVLGRVRNEDVDYFVVEAKQGQRITAEVHAMRLGRAMTDLYVAIMNEARFELAASDDSSLLLQDPVASLIAPEDGRYIIMLRDSAYAGGDNCRYAMHVGTFARPRVVFPAGGQPGETLSVRFIGDAAGDFEQTVTLPAEANNDYGLSPQTNGARTPSPHRFRVNDLPNVIEQGDVDNSHWRPLEETPAAAIPAAFNGIIDTEGQHDWFKFEAKQGQVIDFAVYARSLRSPLDAVINIFKGDGGHLQGNDDQGGPDSKLRFTFPEDGVYYLRIRDHLGGGGPEFIYRVEATPVEPGLRVYPNRNDRNNVQVRQHLSVPQGNRAAILMRVERIDVGGAVELSCDLLPDGVTLQTDGWLNGTDQAPVVIEADADAPLGFRLVEVMGTRVRDNASPVIGGFRDNTALVQGNPNRTEYYHTALEKLPVAVTAHVGFRITAVQPAAPLVREGKMRLRITVERDEGYDQPIRLYMLFNPPGISSTGRVDIPGDQSEGVFEINANGNAPTNTWPLAVHGHAPATNGHAWVSTQLVHLTVEEPFIRGNVEMAACEQGQTARMIVKLQHPREWEGEAELKLLGLPAHATTQPQMITHGQEQAVFEITTTNETPVNQHRGVFCEVTLQVNAEPVVARATPNGTLRVDRPRPAQPAQTAAPAEQPQQPAEQEEQLTRLEQLRRDAQRQREQGGE
ncbi:PPC domain-containing protein [Phycisphaeraceae bacterium D3-23]